MSTGSSRPPFRRPTLVLVDDTPAYIELLVELLKSDFDLTIATLGVQALEICESDLPIDLILLDLDMPGMNGFEVCHRLKASESRREVPVIIGLQTRPCVG